MNVATMKITTVIILGGHIQALGLARQTHKMGVKVVLLLQDNFSVARYSNAVDEVMVVPEMDRLKESLQPFAGKQTMLFPTADEYIEFLEANYDELNTNFVLGIPSPECVKVFADKRATYQFAEKNNIPHPKSWYPNNLDDIKKIAPTLTYPIVVKPAVMHTFHKAFGKKAYRCDNSHDLLERCETIGQSFPIDGLVIQEFLAGGAESLYSYGATVINGQPIAWIMANRIRQNPMDFGNSTTFAISCDIPQIEELAKHILKEMKYNGLAEVEFMYDEKTSTYKFLEINTRAWKWHSISSGMNYGFLSEWIHHINGEKCEFKPEFKQLAWIERLTDYVVSLKSILSGRLTVKDIIKSHQQKKVNAVWSIKDPLPAFMYLMLSPILFVKRH